MRNHHYEFDTLTGSIRIDGRTDDPLVNAMPGQARLSPTAVAALSLELRGVEDAAREAIYRARREGEAAGRASMAQTLRDEFAMAALRSLAPIPPNVVAGSDVMKRLLDQQATLAYRLADAMLEARKPK